MLVKEAKSGYLHHREFVLLFSLNFKMTVKKLISQKNFDDSDQFDHKEK